MKLLIQVCTKANKQKNTGTFDTASMLHTSIHGQFTVVAYYNFTPKYPAVNFDLIDPKMDRTDTKQQDFETCNAIYYSSEED